jgi:hypothetical protein
MLTRWDAFSRFLTDDGKQLIHSSAEWQLPALALGIKRAAAI